MKLINKKQIAAIHVLKAKLKLDDDTYRRMLSGYGVTSSKQLGEEAAKGLIRKLNAAANADKPGYRRYPGKASAKQIRKIKAMWNERAKAKTDTALNKFIKHTTGIDRLEWLNIEDATKVINGLNKI
jgi:phage gp16-like protein